jgi:hypothetical protein
MKLAIADPPYLGRAELFYGEREVERMNFHGNINQMYKADKHPDAHLWDQPAQHEALVQQLLADYDGWAIAMVPDNLRHYLQWVPDETLIAVWHNPRVMPTGRHPRRRWEPVLIHRAPGRKKITAVPAPVGDVFTAPHGHGSFAGAKPRGWTRWVLDMLGYDPATDTVTDLFPGSGAVAAEINQHVLQLSVPPPAQDDA